MSSTAAPTALAWYRRTDWLLLLAGLLASLGLWWYLGHLAQGLAQGRFERQARAAADLLQQRVKSKNDLLLGMRGVLLVKPQLSRSEFERVAASLQLDVDQLSVRNLHFTRFVPAAERTAFEAQARANAHMDGSRPENFAFHPPLQQPEYFVVDYVWPLRGNERSIGLEIHSQPDNLDSILRARATGELVASAPFVLVQQDGGVARSVNLRLPVFVSEGPGQPPRFLGAVGAIIDVLGMVQSMQQRGFLDGLQLSVEDIGAMQQAGTTRAQPLYRAESMPAGPPAWSQDVLVGGRLWRLGFAPAHSFITPFEKRLPSLFGAAGLLVSVLIMLLARKRRLALADARQAAVAARDSETRFHTVFNQAAVGMLQIDSQTGLIVRANQRFCDLLGYRMEELVKLRLQQVSHPDDLERSADLLRQLNNGEIDEYRLEKRYQRKDGSSIWVDVTASAMDAEEGRRFHIVVVQDISQRRQTEEDLRYLAYNDLLTGLPNRRLLMDRLEQAVAASARHHHWGAVLLLDLDHFKTLNETRGHDAGDRLLHHVAARLRACTGSGDTLARQGGDEFVLLLGDLGACTEGAAAQAEEIARKAMEMLREPFNLGDDGEAHHITLSVGITLYDGNAASAEELLKRSELAMYDAKAAGRDALRFFDPHMHAVVAARAQLEADMRVGISAGQFQLHYQPKVAHGAIQGAEALLRWRHPERGGISPAEFIPLAEHSGLILPLGQWVLQTACEQLARWAEQPLLQQLTLAVNVSPRQFHQAGFVAQVLQALASSGAQARRLRLELTESMLLQDVEDTIAKMAQLRGYGVGFSLDDFGTGYSSLAYLKRLPLHELKIDQSFVRDVLSDPNDAAITRTIIALGTSLGLQVTAEGVETEPQRLFLEKHGCHVWQGYLLAPPLPAERFEALVLERAAARA